MEKLIKLVVKCQKELKQGYLLWNTEGAIKNSKEILISKSFGFIKRLIDNKKIDFELDSIIHQHKGIDYNTGKGIVVQKLCDKYESLLMLLAISENPIEDLISYLK